RHQGADHATVEHIPLGTIHREDKQYLVTVHQFTAIIHHQYAICVAVEGNTQVSLLGDNTLLQRLRMGAATIVVDVHAIRLVCDSNYLSTQLLEHIRRDVVTGAIGAIDHNLHALQAEAMRHRAFAEFDIAAARVLDATH